MNSRVLYLGDGQAVRFAIPFPYLSPTHVHVYVNKIEQLNPLEWEFDGDGFVVLKHTPAEKDAVEIIRQTESEISLSQFQDGSILTEAELNLATLQNLYLNQELRDYMDALLNPAVNNIASNLGVIPATAGEVIDAVVQGILDSQLLADLQQRITDIDTNAAQLSNLYVTTEGISAAVTSEQQTRADGDSALSTKIDTVQANVDDNHALISAVQQAYADADSALSARIDSVFAEADGNKALIQTETTARADGDSALASQITTVQSAVDNNSASIQTQATAIAGIKSEYTIKLDVNGYVSGVGLINDGAKSQFIITADQFAVVTPGKTPVVPFAVDANGVYMNNAYIRNLAVDKITGGAIKNFWSINDATGRIVLDTGTFMKVLGVGFGLNHDLIEWFGPKMDVGACTRANAITYVATNGDAYFGGSLSAGTLYNAVSSTNISTTAALSLGPYATNGGTKSIVLSYSYGSNNTTTGSGNGSEAITATLGLYQTINGSSRVKVGTLVVNGTHSWTTESGTRRDNASMSGSITYTDSTPGLAQRTYDTVIESMSAWRGPDPNTTQTITLTSTEQ